MTSPGEEEEDGTGDAPLPVRGCGRSKHTGARPLEGSRETPLAPPTAYVLLAHLSCNRQIWLLHRCTPRCRILWATVRAKHAAEGGQSKIVKGWRSILDSKFSSTLVVAGENRVLMREEKPSNILVYFSSHRLVNVYTCDGALSP